MNPQKRRNYLSMLESARKQDGMMSVADLNRLYCDILHDLLMDSVYIGVPDYEEEEQEPVATDG